MKRKMDEQTVAYSYSGVSLALKWDKLSIHAVTWMGLKNFVLKEAYLLYDSIDLKF